MPSFSGQVAVCYLGQVEREGTHLHELGEGQLGAHFLPLANCAEDAIWGDPSNC